MKVDSGEGKKSVIEDRDPQESLDEESRILRAQMGIWMRLL